MIKDQLPIRGTKELRCGLPELLEIAAHIPCVISVRSGLLDFLAKTDVNMFVIYPKGGIKRQVYSMKDWKRNGIVEEVDIDDFFSDDRFERVDDFLRCIAADETRKETK